MKILLVDDLGQTIATLNDVEKFDGTRSEHVAELMDLMEIIIAAAKPAEGKAAKRAGSSTKSK
ncbi:MAG: hypothetical protein EXQ56_12100 [Acidobacteria bacterium]|nr:hypothetical protein [Acidobacteriota bacterium]